MKIKILTLIITTFIASNIFGQVSIGTGLSIPISSFENLNYGSADLGYQLNVNWDKSIDDNFGISSGILIGTNPINEKSTIFTDGSWSYLAVAFGAFYVPTKNIKLKGFATVGNYGSPDIAYENMATSTGGVRTGSALSAGCNFSVEYSFKNWFVGTNFFYSKPDFNFNSINKSRISNLGFTIGYIL